MYIQYCISYECCTVLSPNSNQVQSDVLYCNSVCGSYGISVVVFNYSIVPQLFFS